MSGKLIVIEGLDGSGKATQTELLARALRESGDDLLQMSFPRYGRPCAEPVKMYLGGAFGQKPGDVNAYAASVLYAVDRFASFKEEWGEDYRSGRTILCDRYTTSNALYQTAKMPRTEWGGFLDWLFDFEYGKMQIPAPDLVVYLDMAPEAALALMNKRYAGDNTKLDIHERDLEHQSRSRKAALFCAERESWRVVSCDDGGVPRPIDQIHQEIQSIVRGVFSC